MASDWIEDWLSFPYNKSNQTLFHPLHRVSQVCFSVVRKSLYNRFSRHILFLMITQMCCGKGWWLWRMWEIFWLVEQNMQQILSFCGGIAGWQVERAERERCFPRFFVIQNILIGYEALFVWFDLFFMIGWPNEIWRCRNKQHIKQFLAIKIFQCIQCPSKWKPSWIPSLTAWRIIPTSRRVFSSLWPYGV